MSASGIKMGDAYITMGLQDETAKGMQEIAGHLSEVGSKVLRQAAIVSGMWLSVAGAVGASVYQTGRYEAALTRIKMVYVDLTQSQMQWMSNFRKLTLRSKTQIAEMIATFGAFTKGLGFADTEARDLARGLAYVSSNMATFAGISIEESSQRFRSAMAGSSEVLDMLGINIKEAALNQMLLAKGFPSISKGATELHKQLARYAIILESMRKQGSLYADATMRTMPRSIAIFKASIQDFLVSAGYPFLDMGIELLEVLTTMVKLVTMTTRTFKHLLPAIAPLFIALGILAATYTGVGLTSIFASKAIEGYNTLLLLQASSATAAAAGNARLALSLLALGGRLGIIAVIIATIAGIIYMVGKGLEEANRGAIGFSLSLQDLWFNLQQGNWSKAWDNFVDGGTIAFKKLAQGFGDLIAQAMNFLYGGVARMTAELNRSITNFLEPVKSFSERIMGDLAPSKVIRKGSMDAAKQLQDELDANAHAWEVGEKSVDRGNSAWARDRKNLANEIAALEKKIADRHKETNAERSRLAEEEVRKQEESLNAMIAKYRSAMSAVSGGTLQAPQALSYRSVEGQRAAYQNQLGVLDRLSKLVDVNQQIEDNTRATNFQIKQLQGAMGAVQ